MSVQLHIKAVPGASCDEISGWLGECLKVRISAPAQSGQANKAIIALISARLKVNKNNITIESGHTSPYKRLRIDNIDDANVNMLLKKEN